MAKLNYVSHRIYTAYDSKVENYLPPFFVKTKGAALRAFTEFVNDPNTQFHKHPADYTLFEIGEFDENSGQIAPYETKINLGVAIEFLKTPDQTTMSRA